MFTGRSVKAAIAATFAVTAFGLATAAPASADLTADDQRFLGVVKELNVPVKSDEDAVAIGQEICKAVAAGQVEPARTVRGVMSRLQNQGLDKGQAAHLVWGAVDIYCPRYSSIVGR